MHKKPRAHHFPLDFLLCFHCCQPDLPSCEEGAAGGGAWLAESDKDDDEFNGIGDETGAQPLFTNAGPGGCGGGCSSLMGGGRGSAWVGNGGGGGGGGNVVGAEDAGGNDFKLPVSSVDQPPARKDGALDRG